METQPKNDMQREQDTAEDRFLVFTIDKQSYGIEIHYIIEIIEMLPITVVPFLPACMKGIINLRGSIIPLMDVRLRFGLPEQAYTERTCIIVLDNDGVQLGLIVDAVQEVTNIPADLRMPPPNAQAGESIRYIKNVGNADNQIQLLLDCDRLMAIQG
ncbi:MAG: chemotaxis protein CheW [Candidatus Pelethousia sp.]|nr:chemotaxis protein CheW [Candidatus Pelethousia sp.]